MDPLTFLVGLVSIIFVLVLIYIFVCLVAEGLLEGFQLMRAFNSFQIVAAFVAWPFLIAWLQDATFRGAPVAFYAACALYVVAFFAMVACVYDKLGDDKK
jgi:hypothetical protein